MIDIRFKLNGREVRASDLGHQLSRSLERDMRRDVEQRIARVKWKRCLEHGKTPTVRSTLNGFSIEACCERFRARIEGEISR